MCDKRRRFLAIQNALFRLYPKEPTGNFARHLNTLAMIISGIVGSKSTTLSKVSDEVIDGNKKESRIKRLSRWFANKNIEEGLYFLPFAEALLRNLGLPTLFLALDGSVVGRGCIVLMMAVIYKKRSLPIGWIVIRGKKGHLPENLHIDLIKQVEQMIPKNTPVVVLGDGEFDGVHFQETVAGFGWKYVCRTGPNISCFWDGVEFKLGDLGEHIEPDYTIDLPHILFTHEQYGPVTVICWWAKGYKDPIYLVTNVDSVDEACAFYSKRFRIETFFSDQKSRGFNIHKSHISSPERISRLLIAACLAYIWIIHLGVLCVKGGWNKIIHRTDRRDLSLFRLGLGLLEHFLDHEMRIPVSFQVPQLL